MENIPELYSEVLLLQYVDELFYDEIYDCKFAGSMQPGQHERRWTTEYWVRVTFNFRSVLGLILLLRLIDTSLLSTMTYEYF
jgi:hypothetical protein